MVERRIASLPSMAAATGIDERPLHIGYYSPALPDSGISNGIVTYTRIMRDALRRLGHAVTIVTTTHIEHADGRIERLPAPNRMARNVALALERLRPGDGSDAWVRFHVLAAFKAARRCGIDVFEIEESHGWAGRLARLGVPIVERLHGPHVFGREPQETSREERIGDLREAAEQKSFAIVEAVTSPSKDMLGEIVNRYGLDLRLSRAIPNPMPIGDNLWDVNCADPNQILCVGRFDLRKGADLVVKAFAEASQIRPLKLVMVGPDSGLNSKTGERWHFEEFVREEFSPAARSSIHFMGPLPPDRIAQLRLESALSIVGSRFESFSYSIAEAMAVGMPVLTSATFGGKEMIHDGIEGRVVPIGDISAMRDAMLDMMSRPARLREMGRAGLDRVRTWLSPERVARVTVNLYRDAISLSQD
jgi:glycosyltransferase involved in cell wall biosynthesis